MCWRRRLDLVLTDSRTADRMSKMHMMMVMPCVVLGMLLQCRSWRMCWSCSVLGRNNCPNFRPEQGGNVTNFPPSPAPVSLSQCWLLIRRTAPVPRWWSWWWLCCTALVVMPSAAQWWTGGVVADSGELHFNGERGAHAVGRVVTACRASHPACCVVLMVIVARCVAPVSRMTTD